MKAISKSLILIMICAAYQIVYAEQVEKKIHFQPDLTNFEDQLKSHPKLKPALESIIEDVFGPLGSDFNQKEKSRQLDQIFEHSIHKYRRELEFRPICRKIKDTKAKVSTSFSAFGYEVTIPWEEETQRHHLDVCSYIAKPGDWLVVIDNPEVGLGAIALQTFNSEIWFNSIFYDINPDSQFDFVKSILSVSPNDLLAIQDQRELNFKKIQIIIASMIKRAYTVESNELDIHIDSIYYFNRPNVKGFQIGKPDTSRKTELLLFPEDNKEIRVRVYSGQIGHITQNHIDYIIRNFKPVGLHH